MEDDEGVAATAQPSEDITQQAKTPKTVLKKPPTREDMPRLESAVTVLRHPFSPRQRTCLSNDPILGPVYEKIMGKCGQFVDKPGRLATCSSRLLCPKEQRELIACIRTTRDASMCHEFRDEVERCGVKMSQRMLRAALSDDWF
ncbi:unnamed protein product [Hapterophycus canaliculatus]